MLCTKLDAECDRQATVVGRLLTTLGDDRRAVAKLFSSEIGEKLQRELRLCLEIFEFLICLINILQLQGALSPRSEALAAVEAHPRTLCIGLKSRARNETYRPALCK